MSDVKLPKQPIAADLLALYDDFAEFNAFCAFFCDAVACLSERREEWLDDVSAEGLCLFSNWLSNRSKRLKDELEMVWRASSQTQKPSH